METPNSPIPRTPAPALAQLAHRALVRRDRTQPNPTVSPGKHLVDARRKLIRKQPQRTSSLQARLSPTYEIRQNTLLQPAHAFSNKKAERKKKSGSSASDDKLSEAAALLRRKQREDFEIERAMMREEEERKQSVIRLGAIRTLEAAVRRRTAVLEGEEEEEDEEEEWKERSGWEGDDDL